MSTAHPNQGIKGALSENPAVVGPLWRSRSCSWGLSLWNGMLVEDSSQASSWLRMPSRCISQDWVTFLVPFSGRFSFVRVKVSHSGSLSLQSVLWCSGICGAVIRSQVTSHPVINFGQSQCRATLTSINPQFLNGWCCLVGGCLCHIPGIVGRMSIEVGQLCAFSTRLRMDSGRRGPTLWWSWKGWSKALWSFGALCAIPGAFLVQVPECFTVLESKAGGLRRTLRKGAEEDFVFFFRQKPPNPKS